MDVVELVLLYLALCLVAGIVGRNRRIGFWGFLFGSVIFTPIISLMFLYFATPKEAARPGPGGGPGHH
jgi:hypothetical protein